MLKYRNYLLVMLLSMILLFTAGCSSSDEPELTEDDVVETEETTEVDTADTKEEAEEVVEVEEETKEEAKEEVEEEAKEEEKEEVEEEPIDLGELGENLIGNADFSLALTEAQPDGGGLVNTEGTWTFHTNNGADGEVALEDGLIKVSPTKVDSPAYGIQLIQAPMVIESGATYEVSITAKAEADRDILIKVGGVASKSWMAYSEKPISLSSEMSTTTYEFKMGSSTDEGARFEIWFAQSDLPVWVESVSLKKYSGVAETVEDVETSEDNGITASVEAGVNMIQEKAWTTWLGDEWSGLGAGELVEDGTTLSMDVTAVGQASYSVQIIQEPLTFIQGSTYQVSFDAMALEPKKVNVNVGRALAADPWYTAYAPTELVSLGTEMETFTFEFTMEEASYDMGKIVFELGTVDGDDTLTEVTIQDVSIIEVK